MIQPFPSDWDAMQGIVPKGYVCYRATQRLSMNGKMDDPQWARAAWTDEFEDIEGNERKPKPRHKTRMKMLWDDDFLYVGASMEEPHLWGTLTEKNSIIFHDNDFEVFIDPNGDNHNYYEFEINALGTIWELTLPKPYKNGGKPIHGTNLPNLITAVHLRGTLNDPTDTDEGWSVEMAFPWADLKPYAEEMACPPKHNDQWRLNASRVQWQLDIQDTTYQKRPNTPEDNWVWSPQGIIDMHRPERWGYVQFSDKEPGADAFAFPPDHILRNMLMQVYHAQAAFYAQNQRWAFLSELGLNLEMLSGHFAFLSQVETHENGFKAIAQMTLPNGETLVMATDESSRIWKV